MDGAAIKEFAERLQAPRVVGDGFVAAPHNWNVIDPASLVKPGPQSEALTVYSLGAVRDYITANRDGLTLASLVAHVVSPQIVKVSGPLEARARTRESYVQATAQNLTDNFLGKFLSHDEFMVGLLTRFADSDDRKRVLALIGNIKHETVKTSSDDGVTQMVQAKTGIVLSQDVAVPNPITLTPYRTFREVTQPSSLFVLRVNSGRSGGLPEVGLFEADGGAWRLAAIDRVRDWLKEALPPLVAVLA